MLALRTTSPHFWFSASTWAPSASGVPSGRVTPCLANCSRTRRRERLRWPVVQPGDGVLRRAGRHEQREPRRHHHVRHAGLGHGRHLGNMRRALRRGDCQRTDLAGADVVHRVAEVVEHDRDVPGDHVLIGGRGAAISDAGDVDVGGELEQFRRQMMRGAEARRSIAVAAGLLLSRPRRTPSRS